MKLYTEEQVKSICYAMIDYAIECGQEIDTIIDKRLESETSIELPSNEEIKDIASGMPTVYDAGWESGARWVKDTILNHKG